MSSQQQTPNVPRRSEGDSDPIASTRLLMERFTFDLALALAGHEVSFEDYTSGELAEHIRWSLRPLLEGGSAQRPNFGEYGELQIVVHPDGQKFCLVKFDVYSRTELVSGLLLPAARQRVALDVIVDGDRIRDFGIYPYDDWWLQNWL